MPTFDSNVRGPGFMPTAEMVNSPDPVIRASQVANLVFFMRYVLGFIDQIRSTGNVLELGDNITTEQSYGLSEDPGVSFKASREDHTHGTPSLSDDTATNVTTASAAGTGARPSRSDHAHAGVHTISKSGSAGIAGDATLSEGTNIALTQAGSDIEIAVTGSVTPSAHKLLSTIHDDTSAATPPARGSLIVGNSSNLWAEKAKGSQFDLLQMGANDPDWASNIDLGTNTFQTGADSKLFVDASHGTYSNSMTGSWSSGHFSRTGSTASIAGTMAVLLPIPCQKFGVSVKIRSVTVYFSVTGAGAWDELTLYTYDPSTNTYTDVERQLTNQTSSYSFGSLPVTLGSGECLVVTGVTIVGGGAGTLTQRGIGVVYDTD